MAGRKNNHYHYAEKFDDKRRRQCRLFVPRRALFVAVLFLLIFGLVSTTFAAYVSSDDFEVKEHSILVDVRTAKAERDIAFTGANADLAATGFSCSGGYIYFDANGWTIPSGYSVYFVIGRNHDAWWATSYQMTNISGTTTWYLNMGSWGTGNNEWPTQLCFLVSNSSINQGNSPEQIKNNSSYRYNNQYTNTYGGTDLSSGTYYYFGKTSGTNSNLSCTSDSNGSNTLLNSVLNAYATTKQGSGSYSPGTTGGTITVTGMTKTATSETSTDTFSIGHGQTNYPIVGSSVSLSATAAAGYTFDGFYPNNGKSGTAYGNSIVMTAIGSSTTNVYAHFYENMHSVTLANDVDNTTTSYSNCIGVATTKSFTAPTKSGYTFSSWTVPTGMTITSGTTSSSTITVKCTSSAAATLTLTANYTINPPTNVSITDNSMKVGDAAVSLNPQYTVSSGITANVSYSIVDENGNDASSVASVTNGNFTASIPGEYTVTISVTATDGTRTSSAVTDTATVIVSPAVPTWTLTMAGYDTGTGSQADPYLVTLGSNFSFTAAITNPPNDNNYVYTWYNGDGEVLGTGSSFTFGAATASEATTSSVEVEVYCVVSYTGASPTTTSGSISKYYIIKSLIKSYEIPDMQKIYATPNDAKMDIIYNITNPSQYDTSLYFSSDNLTFYQVDVAHGAFLGTVIGTQVIDGTTYDKYQYDPYAEMFPVGPKFFYLAMSKTGASAKTDVIHTTVGASSTVQNRPVYFINNIGALDLSTYRVMAFYVDGNGDLKYQTAQDVYKGIAGKTQNQRFRVMIPSDATKISFAVAKRTKYNIPDDSTNAPAYSSSFFYAYTDYVTLSDNYNTVKATAMSNTESDPDADPLYLMTTQYLAYQTTG
ncbi:MAG: hypothetical protein IJH07_04190 [Ruminococcus sp.]|nr:hypothetical protein [Ruminococcus sp.]